MYLNRKNYFTTEMLRFAKRNLRYKLRFLSKRKRVRILKRFSGASYRFRPFNYTLTAKAELKRKKQPRYSGRLRLLVRKYKLFYHLKLRDKSLRKIFRKKPTTNKFGFVFSDPSHTGRFQVTSGVELNPLKIETRLDVLLLRLNLIQYLWDARQIIREKKAFVISPRHHPIKKPISLHRKKLFTFRTLYKYFHHVPLFTFITLRTDLALYRRILIRHLVISHKLLVLPPDHLLMDHSSMVGLRIRNPKANRVRYFWPGSLVFFIGSALYY